MGKIKMPTLHSLREILERKGLIESQNFEQRYATAVADDEVRELLELEDVPITNFRPILGTMGNLYAVREDLNSKVDSHKKQVVAGLILRKILKGKIPRMGINTLIDGGNFNSASALKYFTELFGMKGIYVMSRLAPPDVTGILESPHFEVIKAPIKYGGDKKEREFYEFLFNQMKNAEFRKNKCCLWHAKYGGKAMYPFGRRIASGLDFVPDCIVSCLGAGGTLEGLQIAVQDHFIQLGRKPERIIGEHELSPLFSKLFPCEKSPGLPEKVEQSVRNLDSSLYRRVNGLPHLVIGPHYDEINPLLSKDSIAKINGVIQYNEDDWKKMQRFLAETGINIGNSSAANLSIAAYLANQGKDVLTVIFEPFRDFYKSK